MTNWIDHVRGGDFAAIPTDIGFESAARLAHLIDGYELTGGFRPCSAIYGRVMNRLRRGEPTDATALDLWVALFWAHRGWRHSGTAPAGVELVALDRLAAELRAALLALAPDQKAGLLAAMSPIVGRDPEARRG
ncbi:MAG TPA: hypothetical protein VGH13_04340 [Xanthobacteraceae bacterium]|jgi:hypothetical protein